MSKSTLGRSPHLDQYWGIESRNFGNELRVKPCDPEAVPEFDEVEDYPYEGQERICGRFEYTMPSYDDTEPYKPTGSFEYRCDSGLFLLSTDASKPDHQRVISKINEKLSRDAEITDAISISRAGMWKLLEDASSIDPFEIIGRQGRYDLNDLLTVVNESEGDLEESLQQHRESVKNFDVLKNVVEGLDVSDGVHSVTELDIDLHKCRIARVEADFRFRGNEFVTIRYEKGSIEIEPMSDDSREYAIQLIERDLIADPENGP